LTLDYRWLRSPDNFHGLEATWRRLFDQNPEHSVFLSWEWMSNWWEHFGGSREFRVLCAFSREGAPRLIAPFQVETGTIFGRPYLSIWSCLGANSMAYSDHLGFLRDPSVDEADCARLMDEIWRLGDQAVFRLSDLRADDSAIACIRAWAQDKGLHVRTKPDALCPLLELPSSWDELMARLSGNFRGQIRKSWRQVEADFQVEQIRDPEPLRCAVRELVRLNAQRMDETGRHSSLTTPQMVSFLESVAADMIAAGKAWFDVIRCKSRVVGAAFNLVRGGTVYYYQGGFDPEYSSYRPSTVLFAHVMKRAIENGFRYFDFLRGDEQYKYRWGAKPVRNVVLMIEPPGHIPRFLYYLSRSQARFRSGLQAKMSAFIGRRAKLRRRASIPIAKGRGGRWRNR